MLWNRLLTGKLHKMAREKYQVHIKFPMLKKAFEISSPQTKQELHLSLTGRVCTMTTYHLMMHLYVNRCYLICGLALSHNKRCQ